NFTYFVLDGDMGPLNDQQTDLLTDVVTSAKHLLRLINDVLDISKIEAGSLHLFLEDNVNLNDILKTVVSMGGGLLADKPVQLITTIPDNLPQLRADRQRLIQILVNVVSNACKFTGEGEIVIHAEQSEQNILISVKDAGPGIPLNEQGAVFVAF